MENPQSYTAPRELSDLELQAARRRGFLTSREAGIIVKSCAQTIINWSRKGAFPVNRIGTGRRQIPVNDFVSFLEQEGYPVPALLMAKS